MILPIHVHQTPSEKIIKYSLNNTIPAIEKLNHQLVLGGFKFLENHAIDNYNFDFYCPKSKIAIEIDGYAHEFQEVYSNDAPKKLYIQSLDITVLRFTDYQILTDIEEIIRSLKFHQSFLIQKTHVV